MKHLTRRSLNAALLATTIISASAFIAPLAAHAQPDAYPSKPITLVVPNPPGGLVDTSARLVSEPLARITGQSVVVDNKPGGSGNLAYSNVARSAKDGYTVLVSYSRALPAAAACGARAATRPGALTGGALLSAALLLLASRAL